MLFRETASETNLSVDQDGFSSSEESLASGQSYATRRFEDKMQLLRLDGGTYDSEVGVGSGIWKLGADECDLLGFQQADDDTVNFSVFDEPFKGITQLSCNDDTDDDEWKLLVGDSEKPTDIDADFHSYPPVEQFKANLSQQSRTEESGTGGCGSASSHHGTKMFIGGLRFEVVQAGRRFISWVFEVACGVRLPITSILIHRKAKGGRCGSPTGCASIFVASEDDVELLLSMSQRIYCGAKGIYVTASKAEMAKLFEKKAFTDTTDGRTRGPSHPIVIERAYGAAGHPSARSSRTTSAASVSSRDVSAAQPLLMPGGAVNPSHSPADPSLTSFSSAASSLGSTASLCSGLAGGPCSASSPAPNKATKQGKESRYVQYPGEAEASQLVQRAPASLKEPAGVFIGGLPAEATAVFVAWFFSLIDVPVHPENVSLGADSHFGEKSDSASVRLEESDVQKATKWTKRVLCSAGGVCFANSHRVLFNLQVTRDKAAPVSRPLFIKRRDTGKGVPCRATVSATTGLAPLPAPPTAVYPGDGALHGPLPLGASAVPLRSAPSAPLPVAWEGPQPAPAVPLPVPLREKGLGSRPPPPPYIPNVIISHQFYQVPAGASIQLQLVPVITAPGMVPTPAQPVFQTIPPPPPPLQ